MKNIKKYFTKKYYTTGFNNLKSNMNNLMKNAKELGFMGVMKATWADLFLGRSLKGWIYLITLSLVQIIAYILNPESFIGMIAGLTGIICVIYVNEKRASNYLFGFINSIIYLWMSLNSGFYGEVLTTLYFTVMQPIGLYVWLVKAHQPKIKNDETIILGDKLTILGWMRNLFITAGVWLTMGLLYKGIGANRPFRDSVTDGTNVTGQLLMTGGYAEQWIFWAATNVFSIYLWWGASFEITVMYWVYLLNSIVGWINWTLEAKGLNNAPLKIKIKSFIPVIGKKAIAAYAD